MSDVSEDFTGSSISSEEDLSSSTGSSELALQVSDSDEVSVQNSDSENDSTLGSLCATDEYPKVEAPIPDGNQCLVFNYKLQTPGGKFFQYSGPFPPDPQLLAKLDADDIEDI
ncbi:Protein SprT-like [Trichinella spiralis]|uniref:Protein SprT-like n=1 Tax=Trichinella spiralis TaxID=6334 RepID=A0ABR3KGW2_TRISP